MCRFQPLTRLIALALLATSQIAQAQIEQRCVLMVDRFQDPTELPQFHPVFDQALTADGLLEFDIDTSSPAEQAGLSWQLIKAPPGMTIDPASGQVTWVPDVLDVGVISATVVVTDANARRNRHTFCVEVIDSNSAPQITAIADRAILTEVPFALTVEASDADIDDVLTLTLDTAPAGMTLDPVSGLLEWLPETGDIGSADVTVRATDLGERFDIESFTLTVVDDNAAPVLDPIADRGARANEVFSLTATASDPDDSNLSWSLPQAPAGMVVDSATGQITWKPVTQQLGPNPVTVRVADPLGFADTTDFKVFVDFNRPPVAIDDDGYRVERGDTLSVPAPGVLANDEDPNDDPLTAQLETGPQQGTLTLSADGGFDYTPDNPAGTIGFDLKWEWEVSGGGSAAQPLIANLDDDPAAEIVLYKAFSTPVQGLVAFDGATGGIEWTRKFQGRDLNTETRGAIGDIDLDGHPEILWIGSEPDVLPPQAKLLYAFEHHGGLKWVSEPLPQTYFNTSTDNLRSRGDGAMGRAAISLADLDQDGIPEILVAPDGGGVTGPVRYQVWDAEGRKLDFQELEDGPFVAGSTHTRVEVADLDLDGDPEIVVGMAAWHHDGELFWSRTDDGTMKSPSEFPVVANLDDDPFPELIRRRAGANSLDPQKGDIEVLNHDGSDLWRVDRDKGFNTAPITVADVDGDGLADVLVASESTTDLFEVLNGTDGSVKWSQPVQTEQAGATVFDIDRDGFNEVVFIDNESTVHVWDGRDGTEKFTFQLDEGRTFKPQDNTLPVFADVDADGQAEFVTPVGASFSTTPALRIWESPNDDWAPMRPVWNQQRYHVTNINDDLTVPAEERPHWLQPGLNQAMVNERLPEARIEESDFFEYRAFDGEFLSNTARVDIAVLPPNATPRILSSPKRLASPGFEYTYPVLAVDSDPGEALSVTVAEGPAGMTVDALDIVRWTPTHADLGDHVVVIEATDSIGARASQNFVLEVVAAVVVPDLSGRTEAEAVADLAAVTLTANPIFDTFSDTVPAGEVAAQDPAAGATFAAGADVRIEISRGPVPVNVPRLVGLDLSDAQDALLTAGLSPAPLTWANDPIMPKNVILEQGPAPGTPVPPASDVALIVSGGPRAVITVDPPLIPSGGTATVGVEVRDSDGTPLDPQPDITLSLQYDPNDIFGTLPNLVGDTIETAADSQGPFEVQASFTTGETETIGAPVVALPPISDGPGGTVYTEFTQQLDQFAHLIDELISAVDASDSAAIEALDESLGDLEAGIDLRRLRTMTAIAPEGGVPPSPDQALAGGLLPGSDDDAYTQVSLDLVVLLEQIDALVREGTVPDLILNQLNQELAAVAASLSGLEPSAVGVLDASPSITALLGTYAPRMLVADIRAVRQALRDGGVISADGTVLTNARFTFLGMMSATRIRNDIVKDFYVPYLGEVARAMGIIIAADLLQAYADAGSVVGIITGASQSIHVFGIQPSVIEGFGFDTRLSPNNSVTMIGPSLIDAATSAATGLPSASDFKQVNTAMDAIQGVIDDANALDDAWNEANSIPMGVTSGCILDGTPGCSQMIYPDGFASVYDSDGGLSLPAPVLIITRNLESGGTAVFIANFVPMQEE